MEQQRECPGVAQTVMKILYCEASLVLSRALLFSQSAETQSEYHS